MSKVKAPTGMTISRNGSTFKVTWKKGDSYSTMRYKWGYIRNGKETHMSAVTTTATHVSRSFSAPVSKVILFVSGKKDGNWSDWSRKAINIYKPLKPSLSQELVQTNKTTYTWSSVTDNNDRPIDNAKLQSILVQDCPDGVDALASLKQWNDATTETVSANGSITPVNGAGEDTGLITGKSYARVIRVREYGLGGTSDWEYIKHVYAAPYPARNIRGTVKKTDASLNCQAYWETPSDAGHPIDSVVLQYAIAVPDANMQPIDPSPNPLPEQADTSGTESKAFTIGTPVSEDKCLFLNVVTAHDTEETESVWVLAGGSDARGPLTAPEFTEAPDITSTSITIKATNESAVANSFVVDYLETADGNTRVLGLHNAPTKVYQVSGVEGARVGIKAFVGTWDSALKTVKNIVMESAMVWGEGTVPVAPAVTSFDLAQSTIANNTVNVTWEYSWDDADACEISWSTEPDAWISTDEPEYYIVLKGLENKLAIKGVEAGEPLYVRLRYVKGFDDNAIFSPYSDTKTITIATVPAIPTLVIDKTFYAKGESITCNWVYITSDSTKQAQARIAERIVTNNVVSYRDIVSVSTAQSVTFKTNWNAGTTHLLAVSVANGSGNWSEWSDPVAVTIAEPIECTITQTSLEEVEGEYELNELPLTVTVEGAGTGGQTILQIRRTDDYHIERPTGEDFKGHKGEVVYQNVYIGEDQQTINLEDLQGSLDDGASYEIYASIQDEYGQFDDDSIPFTVNWQYKAVKPTATVTVTDIAEIELGTPTGSHTGDYVDIYRRSVDGNDLIYTGAEFEETYVDPYPTIGDYGYLLVGRNAYGDYITENDDFAWTEISATYESEKTIIDFNGERIELYYNVDVSHSWNKDFKKIKYLGGSIVGDYVAGVERAGNISAVSIPVTEQSMLESMRRLASYTGNCHIRTKDGSSFTACVQVTETDNHDTAGLVREYSVSIEKVDPVELDGLTIDEWEGTEEE